jgi:hypothetical protein
MFGRSRRPATYELDWDHIQFRASALEAMGPTILSRLDQTDKWLSDMADKMGLDRRNPRELAAFLAGVALVDTAVLRGDVRTMSDFQTITGALLRATLPWARDAGWIK